MYRPPPVFLRGHSRQAFFRLLACAVLLALTMCRAQAQGTLTGTVYLEGLDPSAPAQTVNFELSPATAAFPVGGHPTVYVLTAPISVSNPTFTLSLSGIPAGTYNIGIKGLKWLRVVVPNVSVSASAPTTLNAVTLGAGDANDDNVVDSNDFGELLGAFGTAAGDPGYDIGADFNCDGFVDSTDFGLLIGEFNNEGSPYQIAVGAPAYASGAVTLTWSLIDSGGGAISLPSDTTFYLYRSATAAHGSGIYTTDFVSAAQTSTNPYISLTDTNLTPGPQYYQIVAVVGVPPDGQGGAGYIYYALSNQVEVDVPNPIIADAGSGVLRITGFQDDNATKNYQATITNGLLNSLLVFNGDNTQGRDFFHQNAQTGFLPFQFGDFSAYSTQNVDLPDGFHTVLDLTQPNGLRVVSAPAHSVDNATPTPGNGQTVPEIIAAGPTLTFHLTERYNTGDTTTITYQATKTGLYMALLPVFNTSLAWTIGCQPVIDHVVAVQSKAEAPKEHFRLFGSGVTHGLPLLSSFGTHCLCGNQDRQDMSGIPNMRYYFDNGGAMDAQTVAAPGSAGQPSSSYLHVHGDLFTYYTSGDGFLYSVPDQVTCWGRDYPAYFPIQFTFTKVNPADAPAAVNHAPPPPFRLLAMTTVNSIGLDDNYSYNTKKAGSGMYALNGPPDSDGQRDYIPMRLCFDQRTPRSQLNALTTLKYSMTGFWGQAVYAGANAPTGSIQISPSAIILFNPASGSNLPPFDSYNYYDFRLPIPTDVNGKKLTGWFHVKAWLDQGDSQNSVKFIADEDDAEFTVYNYQSDATTATPYLFNAPATFEQQVGLRAQRLKADPNVMYPPLPFNTNAPDFMNEFALLNTLANPNPANPGTNPPDSNAQVLFGSFVETGTTQGDFYNDVLEVVKAYANADNHPYNNRTGSPFTAWSIGNEPDGVDYDDRGRGGYLTTSDIQDNPTGNYITNKLAPGYTAVHQAYVNSSGATPVQPIVIAPNISKVEQPSLDNARHNNTYRLSWLQDLLDAQGTTQYGKTYASGAGLLDAMGVHPYTSYFHSCEEHGIAESLDYLRWMMDQGIYDANGVRIGDKYPEAKNKPIWLTEYGWQWYFHNDMPRLQADYLVRAYALAAALGIPHENNVYFNDAGGDDFSLFNTTTTNSYAPNRGGMAFRILSEQTRGLTAGTIANPGANDLLKTTPGTIYANSKYVHAIAYTDLNGTGKPPVVVVWGNDFLDPDQQTRPQFPVGADTTVTISFTVPNEDVTAFDIMGNPISLPETSATTNPVLDALGPTGDLPAGYTYTIPATGSPVYVHLSNADLAFLQVPGNGAINGWPLLKSRTNYALGGNGGNGGIAYTYDLAQDGTQSADAGTPLTPTPAPSSVINDGFWQYDGDNTVNVFDRRTQKTLNYVPWNSTLTFAPKSGATSSTPVYVAGEVRFAAPHSIDTLIAVCPSNNNVGGNTPCGIRDYEMQVNVGSLAAPQWQTKKSVMGNALEWVLYAHLDQPVSCCAARIVIKDINNGRWFGDKNQLPTIDSNGVILPGGNATSLQATLYELEAWGVN